VVRPTSVGAVSAVLEEASRAGLVTVPRGSGTALDWGAPPERLDIVLDTTGLDRVVEHEAGDLVVVTQAGLPLAALAGAVEGAAQELVADVPRERLAAGCTVGGALATAATGPRRLSLCPGVNAATVRVLSAEGCEVLVPASQGCCGALSVHSGRAAEGRRYARALIDAFADAGVERIVVNAAGCGSTMKEYVDILADEPDYVDRAREFSTKVRDITELLVELGPVAVRHPLPVTIAYHDACHLSHASGFASSHATCWAPSPGCSSRRSPRATSAAAPRGCTTCCTPNRPASSETARRPTSPPPARHCS
jgi:hypothetical protein